MSQPVIPTATRDFSRPDAKRRFLTLACFACVGACNWLLLQLIQSQVIPKGVGGDNGPWVIRPILAFHFGAMAVMTAVSLPIFLAPLQRRWKREDTEAGTRYDPFTDQPLKQIRFIVASLLLLLVYGASLLFYLFSWTTIGPEGIVEHLPWGTLNHSFTDVVSLENIPDGMRSAKLQQDGPWYSINLRSGRSIRLSLDNEGLSSKDLMAVTEFVAARSRLAWAKRTDARHN